MGVTARDSSRPYVAGLIVPAKGKGISSDRRNGWQVPSVEGDGLDEKKENSRFDPGGRSGEFSRREKVPLQEENGIYCMLSTPCYQVLTEGGERPLGKEK